MDGQRSTEIADVGRLQGALSLGGAECGRCFGLTRGVAGLRLHRAVRYALLWVWSGAGVYVGGVDVGLGQVCACAVG